MIKSLAGRCLFAALSVSLVTCVALMNVELHAARSDDKQCIVVFGASGKIGGLVVTEALARGHRVVGISRNPDKLTVDSDRFSAVKGDVTDIESFREVVQGADSIVISVVGSGADNLPENSTHAIAAKIAIAALAGLENAPRVIQVGGASTMIGDKEAILAAPLLLAPEGSPLYGVIFGHLDALNTYRSSDIDWTVIAPPIDIEGWTPGGITSVVRTGHYRTSTTGPVRDANGKSALNVADLAVAIVDEVENRRFRRQLVTVGY